VQYFEDIEVGRTASFGSYAVTREEVTEFAAKYDPQPFHLSDEAAAQTHFGRLSASGWHTCAMTMAMLVAHLKENEQAGLGSPGIDELDQAGVSGRHLALRERGSGKARVGKPAGDGDLQEPDAGVQSGRRDGDDVRIERTGRDAPYGRAGWLTGGRQPEHCLALMQ
jgi:hypothetical protein